MNTNFEIIGLGGRGAGQNSAFQIRSEDGKPLAPLRGTYEEVQRDLLELGGTTPNFNDRSGGFTTDGWRISWATLDRLAA